MEKLKQYLIFSYLYYPVYVVLNSIYFREIHLGVRGYSFIGLAVIFASYSISPILVPLNALLTIWNVFQVYVAPVNDPNINYNPKTFFAVQIAVFILTIFLTLSGYKFIKKDRKYYFLQGDTNGK
jgi:hypothetical protein